MLHVPAPHTEARGENLTWFHRVNGKTLGSWQSYKHPGEDDHTRAMHLREEEKKKPRLSDSSSPISEVSLKLWQMRVSSRHGRVALRSCPVLVFMAGNEILAQSSKSCLRFAHLKDVTKIISSVGCRTSCSTRKKNCQKLNRQRRVRSPLHEQSTSVITTQHNQGWEASGPCPLSTLARFSTLLS